MKLIIPILLLLFISSCASVEADIPANPSYNEVLVFMASDKTEQKEPVEDYYDCKQFARDVTDNAAAIGLDCAFVIIDYGTVSHVVVAFKTSDEGIVFFEPQTDKRIYLQVGGTYQDRVIKEIVYVWK